MINNNQQHHITFSICSSARYNSDTAAKQV